MTVLAFERHAVEASQRAAFEDELRTLIERMREAPGALWADAARAFDDDPSYVIASEWRTPADADAWETGEAATAFRERVDPLLRGDPTRRRFEGAP